MRAAAVLVAALLAGCAENAVPVAIEVYAEPGIARPQADGTTLWEGADGQRNAQGVCGDEGAYQAHVQVHKGTVTITVRDGAGKETRFDYTEWLGDSKTIEGSPGTWTVEAAWSGFAGTIHAQVDC